MLRQGRQVFKQRFVWITAFLIFAFLFARIKTELKVFFSMAGLNNPAK
ncbi:hypothetical protein MuYL_0421 [Mucilaginibacter xinganensis]|uniref:Uncharacterized protein n=1 Tax=Mucilaginibacter xinganensis TaxID=1234841 RepID=A0A223NRJ5_9SPHI|nr:hypothetical protein MuYL_0421 [Mucilaginibacter xinganensis]